MWMGVSHITDVESIILYLYFQINKFVKGFHPLLWSRNQCVCLTKNTINCFEQTCESLLFGAGGKCLFLGGNQRMAPLPLPSGSPSRGDLVLPSEGRLQHFHGIFLCCRRRGHDAACAHTSGEGNATRAALASFVSEGKWLSCAGAAVTPPCPPSVSNTNLTDAGIKHTAREAKRSFPLPAGGAAQGGSLPMHSLGE